MKMTGREAGFFASIAVYAIVTALAADAPSGPLSIVSATVDRYRIRWPPNMPRWVASKRRFPSVATSESVGHVVGDGRPGGGVAKAVPIASVRVASGAIFGF